MSEMEYALGHTADELRRLATQARLIDPITRRFFQAAGITEGMSVLDIGSGAGDVAMLCADLVGPRGRVIGTDLALTAIETARKRAAAAGLSHVSFRHGDPTTMSFDVPFDAVVGRYVLQFISSPAEALQRMARHVPVGGIVAFHELDWDGARSWPISPTYDRLCSWLSRTIEASGAQVRLGAGLATIFKAAGLPSTTVRLESIIASGPAATDAVNLVVDLAKTLMPRMEGLGIALAPQVGLETLAARILSEVGSVGTLIGRAEVGCWTTKPD